MNSDTFNLSQIMLQLFDLAVEATLVLDTEGRVLYTNQATATFGGTTVENICGRLLWEVFPDTAGAFYEEHFRRAVREQTPVRIEFYFPPADKWFEVRFYPSPDAVALFAHDITERKVQSEAIRLSEEKYRRLVETVDQGFCVIEMIWNAEGHAIDYRFLEINPVFEQMTGLKDASGKRMRELVPNLESFWAERYGEVVRTGEAVRFQNGSVAMGRVFDVFASPLDGNRVAILFTDETEKQRNEQEREDLTLRLRRAIAETHHRVKNNLQVISALVEIQATDMDSLAATPLHRINQHVKALSVIHDLLTQHVKEGVDMDHAGTQAVLETLVPLLRQTIGERRITMAIDNVMLTAQKAASFALLVSECVSNAVKHSANCGEIEITLKVEGNRARLEICDDGSGFPADFDPRTAANTGLHLIESTARWDLGGTVQYDNHGLGGGRVSVTFPIFLTP